MILPRTFKFYFLIIVLQGLLFQRSPNISLVDKLISPQQVTMPIKICIINLLRKTGGLAILIQVGGMTHASEFVLISPFLFLFRGIYI